jgi:hypothetical protein
MLIWHSDYAEKGKKQTILPTFMSRAHVPDPVTRLPPDHRSEAAVIDLLISRLTAMADAPAIAR